jgi:hypothetical protein
LQTPELPPEPDLEEPFSGGLAATTVPPRAKLVDEVEMSDYVLKRRRELIEMPLFLEPEIYINVPLELTYTAAYRGVPQRWKRVLEDKRPL